jgi:hypothetical protein
MCMLCPMLRHTQTYHNPSNFNMTTINVQETKAPEAKLTQTQVPQVPEEAPKTQVPEEAPKMRMRTGFDLFRTEEQKRMKSETPEKFNLTLHMPAIAAKWKNSSNEFKADFREQALQSSPVPKKSSRKTRKRSNDVTETTTTPLKKKRKQRDPNLPKRPSSAFIFFSCQRRPSLVKEFPLLKPTELLKCMGLEWRKLVDRAPYKAMSDLDKIRYADALVEMNASSLVPPNVQ